MLRPTTQHKVIHFKFSSESENRLDCCCKVVMSQDTVLHLQHPPQHKSQCHRTQVELFAP